MLPTNGKSRSSGSITADQARLDISARSVWNVCERAFFDVRVFNPLAPSNSNKQPSQMYTAHEAQKKRAYNDRVIQIEKESSTPLVFSTSGGMGREAQGLMKKIAERMELTSGQRYSDCMGFMRKRLRFELLKTTLIALRGYRGLLIPFYIRRIFRPLKICVQRFDIYFVHCLFCLIDLWEFIYSHFIYISRLSTMNP